MSFPGPNVLIETQYDGCVTECQELIYIETYLVHGNWLKPFTDKGFEVKNELIDSTEHKEQLHNKVQESIDIDFIMSVQYSKLKKWKGFDEESTQTGVS